MKIGRLLQLVIVTSILLPMPAAAQPTGFSAGLLFPNDEILQVRVSPDGDWIVATAYSGRTVGLLAQRFGSLDSQVVHTTNRAPRSLHWIGRDLLLVQFDTGPSRQFLRVQLRRTEGSGFEFDTSTFRVPGYLVDALPQSDGQLVWEFDHRGRNSVHRVSLDELQRFGRSTPHRRSSIRVGELVGWIRGTSHRWLVDEEGIPLVAWRLDDEGYSLLYRSARDEKFKTIHSHQFDDGQGLRPHGWTRDRRNLLVTAYNGAETIGLFEYDPRTRSIVRTVYQREDVDLDGIDIDAVTGDVLSVHFDQGSERRIHYLESSYADFAPRLASDDPPIEAVRVVSSSTNRDRFVYWTQGPTEPGAHYLRNAEQNETILIGQKGKRIDRSKLRPLETFRVESTDGVSVEALLTLPEGTRPEGHPLVVMPHGGPIGVHDRQAFDPIVQYLASWGFAVLQANYRGSSGYGKEFRTAGKRQWGRGIEDDIFAAIASTRARPDIDGSRVCIIGVSYGGFSAITGVLRQPDAFRCAATINGVTDVSLQFESSDSADSKRAVGFLKEFIGDPATERDEITAISPVYRLEELRTPVLVVYGDADRRVDPDHAHRLITLLHLYGKEYVEIRVKDGRHSFTRDQWRGVLPRVRRFLTTHLMPGRLFTKDPVL